MLGGVDIEYFFNCIAPVMQFTDDSAMTYSLAKSLIETKGLDVFNLAKKFVKSYYQEPNRGYGPGVVTVRYCDTISHELNIYILYSCCSCIVLIQQGISKITW